MARQYSINDIAKYKPQYYSYDDDVEGSGYGDWIANLNDIRGSGNTNTRIHPDKEPSIIRNYGDQRIQEIRILRNRDRTEFMLTLTINDGTIFGDKHIIIQKDTDRPLEFAIDTDRPRLSTEFRVYNDNEALTVRQFLTSGYQNHSIGTMQQYIEERFLANNMMTADIARFIKDREPRVVDGKPFSYIADVEGSGLESWYNNHMAKMYKFNNAVGIDGLFGSGLNNNILINNKMSKAKKKFGNTDTQLYEGMLGGREKSGNPPSILSPSEYEKYERDRLDPLFIDPPIIPRVQLQPPPTGRDWRRRRRELLGGSMEEMGFDDEMEGGAWHDWLANLYDVIRKPKEALGKMPKPIWDFNQIYQQYGIVSMEVCREPLSKGLQNVIDRASRGDLIKNLAKSPYEDLFHLYANVHLRNPLNGKTKSFRIEKNQRVEIFDNIVPPKGASGKCMGVPNIPIVNGKPTIGWFKFWENTDNTTWEYSANKYNCQAFLKTRLETLGLLTPALKEFIMQDIDTILDPVKNKFQISIAKGITDFANIMQNIYKGGEMGGDGMCNCGSQCGCGVKGGWIESHVHLKQGKYPDITGDNTNTWASDYAGRGKKKKKQKGGWVEPHIHQVWPREGVGWTGEVVGQYYDPDFGKH